MTSHLHTHCTQHQQSKLKCRYIYIVLNSDYWEQGEGEEQREGGKSNPRYDYDL